MRSSDWSSDVCSSDLLDFIAEFPDLQRQFLPVDGSDLLLKLIEGARFEAAPCAVLVPRGVHNDIVGITLRVLGAAGAVLEAGDTEIAVGLEGHGHAVPSGRASCVERGCEAVSHLVADV